MRLLNLKMFALSALMSVCTYVHAEQDYESINLNGLEIYGCEIFVSNEKGIYGTNINSVSKYTYLNKNEQFLIVYMGGSVDDSSNLYSSFIINVKKEQKKEFLKSFQKIKNKCAFVIK